MTHPAHARRCSRLNGVIVKSTSRKLADLYAHLRNHFGYAHPWWPGTPLEIALTAILVQQCDWSAAWGAVMRLRENELLSLPSLARAELGTVQRFILGVAFGPTKAKRLIQFARDVLQRGHETIESYLAATQDTLRLREDLLTFKGIGEETADCMLLFASEHASFIVDAYTRRIMHRLRLFPELDDSFWLRGSYGAVQEFFSKHLLHDLSLYDDWSFAPGLLRPVALFRDYHAQLVELAKHHCLKSKPRCHHGGRKGWADYAVCETHCQSGACGHCPLAERCGSAAALL
jgi:endonuclease III related protein